MIYKTASTHLKLFVIAAVMLLANVFLVVGGSKQVSADSAEFNFNTGCTASVEGSYTAILPITAAQDVYVKLGIRGQTLQVSAYAIDESASGKCQTIGRRTTVNGDRWTKVGRMQPTPGQRTVLEIISPKLVNVPNASRPAVLLIDAKNPICTPKQECELTIDGQQAFVKSPTTLRDKASLFVGIPIDPAKDSANRVQYYAGGKLVYSTQTLQPFDLRYATYARQQLQRVVKYKSGQEIVYQETTPDTFSDSLPNFLFRTFQLRSKLAAAVYFTAAALILLITIRILLNGLNERYQWRLRHGFVSEKSLRNKIGRYAGYLHYKLQKPLHYGTIIFGIPAIVLLGYGFSKVYAADVYLVNGTSMDSTFSNGQSMLVNKLPQTIAQANNTQAKFERGEVIIVNAIYGLVSPKEIDENQHTIVKRVLGLPGERVTVTNGQVVIYNDRHPEGIKVDEGAPWSKTMHKDTSVDNIDVQLANDELFVSGDNRPESVDSRLNGPLKTAQVIGKVVARW